MAFRSFRSRLLFFLLALLIPVLGGIFYYVNNNNTQYTEETINSYLQLGADVFDYTRDQHAQTLLAITNSLTFDFGFRAAYAARDPATLFDAALNVLDRSLGGTDMLMITDLDMNVIIDTETQGFEQLEGGWRQLLEEADGDEAGRADMIVTIDDAPYQVIAIPLYLPRQVAWIIGGFALDEEFVNQVKETVVSEVSILRLNANSEVEVIASTLVAPRQQYLAQQIDFAMADVTDLQRIDFQPEEYTTLLRRLYGSSGAPLQIFAAIQRSYDENNENVVQFRRLLIEFYALILVVSLIGVVWLARSISNPLTRLAQVVRRIEEGDYGRTVKVGSKDELGLLADSVNSMAKGLAEKEKVRDLLGKVVSQQVAEELLKNPVELGGEERIVTVLFSDIRGFTSFCEGLPPQQVLEALNQVLSKITDIIEQHGGVVDKFNGDAVMALFGAPLQSVDDAGNAMEAGLDIIAALEAMNSELSACVGINTGLVVAGNLGSSNRLNYSVIGDSVNLAARLESLTRYYHVNTLVSEASQQAAPQYVYRELDQVRVAGKQEAVKIFELIGRQGEVSQQMNDELIRWDAALACYRQGAWGNAEAQFSSAMGTCDNKGLYQVFLERIARFKENPPPREWQGIFTFGSK